MTGLHPWPYQFGTFPRQGPFDRPRQEGIGTVGREGCQFRCGDLPASREGVQGGLQAGSCEGHGELDYDLEEVGVQPPVSIRVPGLPGELMGLYVKERDLSGVTDQFSMSQGMFLCASRFSYKSITPK